ncbi:MAG: imidazole glycerol phosphate synthase cyclase subunit [Phycisphaerales bacterium]|nr:imidazole glycerol phosphate synthase cyclase subunit [Phycisphaerales bacterium]
MPFQRLIPSLLIHEGRLVKGRNFRDLRDAGLPHTTARAHNHQGADELLVCDIDASRDGLAPQSQIIKSVAAECHMPLCVAGGIRGRDEASVIMDAGADKICLTTTALVNPELVSDLAHQYGSQAVVIGVDVIKDQSGDYCLYDHRSGATVPDRNPLDWMSTAVDMGAGEVRLMAVDREGTLEGYDLDLYREARDRVQVPIILEGGAGTLNHVEDAFEAGVDGIGVGAMLVFSDANLVKIKQHLITAGKNVRR